MPYNFLRRAASHKIDYADEINGVAGLASHQAPSPRLNCLPPYGWRS
jgi:hypothetical protein